MNPIRIALFGDPAAVPHVAGVAGLKKKEILVSRFDAKRPLAGTFALRGASIAHGVMASSMWKIFSRAKKNGCLTVNHWIGTDVSQTLASKGLREQFRQTAPFFDAHWSVAPWLTEELYQLGIHAREVPIVSPSLEALPLPPPDRHLVLSYAQAGKEEFYGVSLLRDLAAKFPKVPFVLCGGGELPPGSPDNLKAVGFAKGRAMEAFYRGASVLVRLPQHDGLSKMALDMLARGREVLWNHPLEGARLVRNAVEAQTALGEILDKPPVENRRGRDLIAQKYSAQAVADRMLSEYARLLDEAAARK
ncbi:MAG: hypothetical protein AB1405_01530 [Bdellovibrionota bacterium]